MKKIKQTLALLGVIILIALYLITLFCAIFDSSDTMKYFYASIFATVVIPVLIWAYTFIYRLIMGPKDLDGKKESTNSENTKENKHV